MRTFKGHLLTDKDMQPTLPISHSPITHLDFVQCSSALGYNYLIHICDNLTSFKYTQQEDNNLTTSLDYNSVYFKSLQPAPFAEVLSTRRDTLRSITIDISRHSYNYGGVHSDDWIGGMAEYTNLRSLQIRAPNFIGRGRAARFDGTATPRMNLVEFFPTSLEGALDHGYLARNCQDDNDRTSSSGYRFCRALCQVEKDRC